MTKDDIACFERALQRAAGAMRIEVEGVEDALPAAFRDVVLSCSREMSFGWRLPATRFCKTCSHLTSSLTWWQRLLLLDFCLPYFRRQTCVSADCQDR